MKMCVKLVISKNYLELPTGCLCLRFNPAQFNDVLYLVLWHDTLNSPLWTYI